MHNLLTDDSDFLLQNQENNKLLTEKVSNEYIIYSNAIKLLTYYVSNLLTYNKENWKLGITYLKGKVLTLDKILSNNFYSDIILFLLKNDVIYPNLLRKLRTDKSNYKIIYDAINFLLSNRVIKEVSIKDKEYVHKIHVFYEYFKKNMSHSGAYQRNKIKFYALTPEWKELLSLFEDVLISKSKALDKIDNFRGMLLRTHEELQRKYKKRIQIIEQFANLILELRKNTQMKFGERKIYIIEHWAEEIFPSYALRIPYEDLELIFKTYYTSKEPDTILKKKIINHLKEVFGL